MERKEWGTENFLGENFQGKEIARNGQKFIPEIYFVREDAKTRRAVHQGKKTLCLCVFAYKNKSRSFLKKISFVFLKSRPHRSAWRRYIFLRVSRNRLTPLLMLARPNSSGRTSASGTQKSSAASSSATGSVPAATSTWKNMSMVWITMSE